MRQNLPGLLVKRRYVMRRNNGHKHQWRTKEVRDHKGIILVHVCIIEPCEATDPYELQVAGGPEARS